jgi:hypothetical protein
MMCPPEILDAGKYVPVMAYLYDAEMKRRE